MHPTMNVKDQLVEAALQVYAEGGYHGATTRRIAAAAGVNEITLFRHFGSKDVRLREALAS
jgi:AcrR family transcriptional regulator